MSLLNSCSRDSNTLSAGSRNTNVCCVNRLRRILVKTILVVILLLFLLFSIRLYQNETYFRHFEPWPCNVTNTKQSATTGLSNRTPCYNNNDTKMILFYTPWFERKPWPGINSTELYLSDCPEKKCEISYNVYDIGRSDLVIFHASDMPTFVRRKELQQIQKYRCPSQRMAFITHEPVFNESLHDIVFIPDGFFNWTITFKRESDFHHPYGGYVRLPSAQNPPKLINYAADKTKFVLWAVSRCGRIRDKYVKKLLQYIKVDIYGGCSGIFGQNNQCSKSDNCDDLFKSYKFYLAFENCVCTDYITEKFWRALGWNSVPVVLTKEYYGQDVVPPRSFISVQDFPSVKALAEYLSYLDENDTAYNEYFSWKQTFALDPRKERGFQCDICDALHNECLKPKAYHDFFKTFWNEDVDCKEREETLSKLIDKE